MSFVKDNLVLVKEKIAAAAVKSGRRPEDICLVAVTKTIPLVQIEAAAAAGIKHIGESRIQEAKAKADDNFSELTWHLIGHLQRNKAKLALEIFDLIHSLDSLRLAHALQRRAEELDRTVDCLLQVNVAGEQSKYGILPDQLPSLLRELSSLSRLKVRGLMTIAPYAKDPEQVRPVFRSLRQLACDMRRSRLPRISLDELSMGMSADFEVAIEEGATLVRVGTAIFGHRKGRGIKQ